MIPHPCLDTCSATAVVAGKTVLVVADSDSLRTVVKLTLRTAGYTVVEADGGEHALALLDAHPAALIVCDLHLPQMDGLSLARQVKATARHRFTPIVMLTPRSQASKSKKDEGRAAGVRAWITRPFEPAQLVDAAARLCYFGIYSNCTANNKCDSKRLFKRRNSIAWH